ncbi:MAG: 50S ribosomal protein L25/general stress protein Ctc [Janthinobacterium lividum]
MSTFENFNVQPRETTGGGPARALRRTGLVPGILYGGEGENIALSVDPRDILKGLNQSGFYTTIFELDLHGKKEQALARHIQFHPVTDAPMHIDFWRVSKDSKIHLAIPIQYINENKCPGIKQGGLLNTVIHALEVTCSSHNIPEHFTIDLTDKEIGTTIHTDELTLPEGVIITHAERDNILATIVVPKPAEEETAVEAEAEAAPSAPTSKK